MTEENLKQLFQEELPRLLRQDPQFRAWVRELVETYALPRAETESRFEQLLAEIRTAREEGERRWREELNEERRRWEEYLSEEKRRWDEQTRKWEEQNRKWEEQNRKWEEQNRKWEEQNRRFEEHLKEERRRWEEHLSEEKRRWDEHLSEEKRRWDEQNRKWEEENRRLEEMQKQTWDLIERMDKHETRVESYISAIGARWGVLSEQAFRDGLRAILADHFNVQVINYNEFDENGEVFGWPDQVELDLIVKNGSLIICELKSSVSRGDVATFKRKVEFYERRHGRKANRLIIISPMPDPRAYAKAQELGIEVYSYPTDAPPQ